MYALRSRSHWRGAESAGFFRNTQRIQIAGESVSCRVPASAQSADKKILSALCIVTVGID
jgi:hypothetical protein